ncbi:MAG: hypothetical protein ABIR54_19240 [Burkholderiaceae bacterium]
MGSPDRFDHLRLSALDLLDAGNNSAAVAQLLAVPVSVVQRWRDEPVPPRPDPVDVMAAQRARGQAIAFRTTLFHTGFVPFRLGRAAVTAYVCASIAIGLFIWLGDHADGRFFVAVDVSGLFGLLRLVWPELVLGPREVSMPGLFGRRTMAYADLADYWLVLHVLNDGEEDERVGRLLTLHSSRAGVRPFEVFIPDGARLDPQIVERLETVKQANRGVGPLTPLKSARAR